MEKLKDHQLDGSNRHRITAPEAEESHVVDGLWDVNHVAAYLAVSTRTAWRWVSEGRIPEPDVRIGKTTRWRPQTVIDFIESIAQSH